MKVKTLFTKERTWEQRAHSSGRDLIGFSKVHSPLTNESGFLSAFELSEQPPSPLGAAADYEAWIKKKEEEKKKKSKDVWNWNTDRKNAKQNLTVQRRSYGDDDDDGSSSGDSQEGSSARRRAAKGSTVSNIDIEQVEVGEILPSPMNKPKKQNSFSSLFVGKSRLRNTNHMVNVVLATTCALLFLHYKLIRKESTYTTPPLSLMWSSQDEFSWTVAVVGFAATAFMGCRIGPLIMRCQNWQQSQASDAYSWNTMFNFVFFEIAHLALFGQVIVPWPTHDSKEDASGSRSLLGIGPNDYDGAQMVHIGCWGLFVGAAFLHVLGVIWFYCSIDDGDFHYVPNRIAAALCMAGSMAMTWMTITTANDVTKKNDVTNIVGICQYAFLLSFAVFTCYYGKDASLLAAEKRTRKERLFVGKNGENKRSRGEKAESKIHITGQAGHMATLVSPIKKAFRMQQAVGVTLSASSQDEGSVLSKSDMNKSEDSMSNGSDDTCSEMEIEPGGGLGRLR